MAKRKPFYVTMNVFESGIPPMAKLVLTYLSSCCNKEGTCFPSMATIARKCGICKNSARKGVHAPESAGIISIKPSYTTSKNGKRRRQANIYTLHVPTAGNASAPVQQMYSGGARDGEEINNNSNMIMAVPFVGITDREQTEWRAFLIGCILTSMRIRRLRQKSIRQSARCSVPILSQSRGTVFRKARFETFCMN